MDVNNKNRHLGHLFLEHMLKRPNALCQIDAATGVTETNASVLSRSIRLAKCLRNFGAKPGDVLALHGMNHLDLHIPFYAALMNGLTIVGVDPLYKFEEIKALFKVAKPKIAFCQCEHLIEVATELGLETKVVTFCKGKHSMHNFIENYDRGDKKEFRPAEFDTDKIYAWLISTSGTTGKLKLAAVKHKPCIDRIQRNRPDGYDQNGEKNRPCLNLSPVQWTAGFNNAISMPLYNQCKIQTSLPHSADHVTDIINKYRPVQVLLDPSMLGSLLNNEKKCDLTCFDVVQIAGGKVHRDIIGELRKRMRDDAIAVETYGLTETLGYIFSSPVGPVGSCGKPTKIHQVKLIDPDTDKEITSPNTPGELWVKGPMFTEYYNNPAETAAVLTKDNWLKTGDLLYRDKDHYYYYVERLGMLIKYRNHHIAPMELVSVIRQHPGVLDVSVTSVPNVFDCEHPVACVVRRPGFKVTAREIKDLVANKLSYSKRLRGGVIFMERLPRTSTGKVARAKLKQIALIADRE